MGNYYIVTKNKKLLLEAGAWHW